LWGLLLGCGLELTVAQAAIIVAADCAFMIMTEIHFRGQPVESYNSQLRIINYLSLTTGFSGAILGLVTCQIRWLKWASLEAVRQEHLDEFRLLMISLCRTNTWRSRTSDPILIISCSTWLLFGVCPVRLYCGRKSSFFQIKAGKTLTGWY
jgi:hypothetical protein